MKWVKPTVRLICNRKKRTALLTVWAIAIGLLLISAIVPTSAMNIGRTGYLLDGSSLSIAGGSALREAPPLMLPEQPKDETHTIFATHGNGYSAIDLSAIEKGYVLAKSTEGNEAVLSIEKDGVMYLEQLPADGKYHAYPLSMNDGYYAIKINIHKYGMIYDVVLKTEFTAVTSDALVRYTIPTPMANYAYHSRVVELSREIYAKSADNQQFASNVMKWIHSNIMYDATLAENYNEIVYVPNLNRVLVEKRAICADYASLFAAMMRICGVPCQIIYGYVVLEGEEQLYHAWNMVWLEDENKVGGWWRYDATSGAGHVAANEKASPLPQGTILYGPAQFVR